jgi:VIT1/CCC1 family predicted Fe2+/Mn2+ transporter
VNIVLWALQIVLAIKFVSVAYSHGLRPDPVKMRRGRERFGGRARPLSAAVAICAFLGAVALVLPAAIGAAAWLTPWAAALLAVMMLGAIGFHLSCRDNPRTVVSLVLFALAAFVAYGRWTIVPL